MPKQLIYTSSPNGLESGRSGFQIVAQHHGINQRLLSRLEKESVYEVDALKWGSPTVSKFFKISQQEEEHYVVSKLQPCGVDFTGRPNHIAHHVLFQPEELPQCPPAALHLLWKGWRNKWENRPRYLGNWDRINYEDPEHPFYYREFAIPAKFWDELSGDAGNAALPLEWETATVYPVPKGNEEKLLRLFFESQAIIPLSEAWEIPYIDYLTDSDNPHQYQWIGYPVSEDGGKSPLGKDSNVLDLFGGEAALMAPANDLADIARGKRTNDVSPPAHLLPVEDEPKQTVSLTPIDEPEYQQDELGLQADDSKVDESVPEDVVETTEDEKVFIDFVETHQEPEGDNTEDTDLASSEAHDSIESFMSGGEPISTEKIELPDFNLHEDEEEPEERRSLVKPILIIGSILVAAGLIFLLVLFFPFIITWINQLQDPYEAEISETMTEEAGVADSIGAIEERLQNIDYILESGQFLLARSYLRNPENQASSEAEEYQRLNQWYTEQQETLRDVNRAIDRLQNRINRNELIDEFESDINELRARNEQLASDLQPTVALSLENLVNQYEALNLQYRLKLPNEPVFLVMLNPGQRSQNLEYIQISSEIIEWVTALEGLSLTSSLDNIEIMIAPYQSLNRFELNPDSGNNLTLWKKSNDSLVIYIENNFELLEFNLDRANATANLLWMYDADNQGLNTVLPDPPLILALTNTLTQQAVYMIVSNLDNSQFITSETVTRDFLGYDLNNLSFSINDPVLSQKISKLALSDNHFLKLRSENEIYQFAWDANTEAFHLFETRSSESVEVKRLQNELAMAFEELAEYDSIRQDILALNFMSQTPLWTLGGEVFDRLQPPTDLLEFKAFRLRDDANYADYLSELLRVFAAEYTVVQPQILEDWISGDTVNLETPGRSAEDVRNTLIRTSKRFRTLLRDDSPQTIESWRHFITTYEFWLLGEYTNELLDILELSGEDIRRAETGSLESLESSIDQVNSQIQQLQKSLETEKDLSEIDQSNRWVLEITSLDSPSYRFPLILFE